MANTSSLTKLTENRVVVLFVGLAVFLFAVVTVMNNISGEFESGTIVPLLTKPVSRTMVFLGKLFATFITLLSVYAILFIYMAVGGTIVYGSQNNLHLLPLSAGNSRQHLHVDSHYTSHRHHIQKFSDSCSRNLRLFRSFNDKQPHNLHIHRSLIMFREAE